MAKMASLWSEQYEADLTNGCWCLDCSWSSENIIDISFCPACGSDNVYQSENARKRSLGQNVKKNQKRRSVSVREFQSYRDFHN